MTTRRLAWLAAAFIATASASAEGQSWRTLNTMRRQTDSAPMNVQLLLGGGSFEVLQAPDGTAWSVVLRYDAEHVRPRFDVGQDGTVILGAQRWGQGPIFDSDRAGSGVISLSASSPMELAVDVGAASANMQLGGLLLRRVHIRTGASQSTIRFGEKNGIVMDDLMIDASAGSVRATGLANARAATMNIQAQAGKVELEFDGEWSGDLAADVRVVAGAAEMRVPADIAIEITASSSLLSSIAPEGFVRDGDVYRSPNWSGATFHLRFRVHSVLGSLSIRRIAALRRP
jgi:hypothetical protein